MAPATNRSHPAVARSLAVMAGIAALLALAAGGDSVDAFQPAGSADPQPTSVAFVPLDPPADAGSADAARTGAVLRPQSTASTDEPVFRIEVTGDAPAAGATGCVFPCVLVPDAVADADPAPALDADEDSTE